MEEQTNSKALLLPLFAVQHDWYSVCQENKSFWVSFYRPGEQTIHGDFTVEGTSKNVTLRTASDFKASVNLRKKQLQMGLETSAGTFDATFTAEFSEYNTIHGMQKTPIDCIDVTSSSNLAVTGARNSSLRVWQTDDGTLRRDLIGHVGDINAVKWFPSGKVILSASSDYTSRIWDCISGDCVAILKGHTGGVLGLDIVGRGRNVISCSRDGVAKLWDLSTQKAITTFGEVSFENAANDCCLADSSLSANKTSDEVETEGNILVVAHENSSTDLFDVRTNKNISTLRGQHAMNCCALQGEALLTGSAGGYVHHWDLRILETPMRSIKRSPSPINSISFVPQEGVNNMAFWAGTRDGLAYQFDLEKERVTNDLTGPNCDSISGISTFNNFVFTTCSDGIVRKYKLN